MLTSSANQYLRPEYLTPLPTTLDAKKSPLALLAQTCSQIGVDPPQTGKSMLTSHDNKSSSKTSKCSSESTPTSRDKSSPAASLYIPPTPSASSTSSMESTKSNSSFKPYESCLTESKSSSPEQQQRVSSVHSSSSSTSRSRTPATSSNRRCSSNQSASSGGRAATPQGRKSSTPSEPRASPCSRPNDMTSSAAAVSSPSRPTASMAATTTTTSAAAYGLPYPPQLPPMDHMTASSLMSAQHHAALKSSLAHPYLSYARMKTPSGAETLVPVCRDPYCTGCQLNSHLLASAPNAHAAAAAATAAAKAGAAASGGTSGPCPAGCAQCDHGKSSAVAAAVAASASPYAAYAHAQLVALAAASQVPYVCNWIGSDAAYCGKRFATSDELLQHFRSHTGQPAPGGDANAAAAAAATTAAALSLLTPPGLAAGHPLLSRTYPTPPLSPLASARYHPYGKPHYGAPGLGGLGLPLPPPPHALQAAGLPPYFSPYSLYAGSRLGAASGMHP